MGVSRACASKWVNRYRAYGEIGLHDRPSVRHHQPTAASTDVVARIEVLRRTRKWSASRIAFQLSGQGVIISRRTVSRHLAALGLNRRRFIDPTGQTNPSPQRIIARRVLADEFLYARTRTSETQRAEAPKIWNIHFNYHRPHSAAAGQPPASRLTTGVTNLRASYGSHRRSPRKSQARLTRV
jgi:hypothetical protein